MVQIGDRLKYALTFELDQHQVRKGLADRLTAQAPVEGEARAFHDAFELALHFADGTVGMRPLKIEDDGDIPGKTPDRKATY